MPEPGRLRFLLVLHGQLFGAWKPAELTFLPGLSRPPWEDTPCLREQYKSCVRALLVFHITWRILVSLSLVFFSTLSFPWDRTTPGQRPFAILPPSIHHEFLPDPVAQVSLDSTLDYCHRLLSFLGSQRTLWPKGPLGRYLGDAPPSLKVSLSLHLPGQKIRWRPFLSTRQSLAICYGVKPIWRRHWHPTPVLLPGKSHGQRSLVGCSPWGR